MATSTTHAAGKTVELAHSNRLQYVLLASITLLALGLRFYKLGEWSFWIDEIFTINRAQAHYSSLEETLRNIPPFTNWVPLSLLLISGAMNTFGTSEWTVRLVPALIGAFTAPILYFPVRRMFGSTVALIFAFLLAISPWHVQWSQNGRFYVALMLLYMLTLLAFYFGIERNRVAYIIVGLLVFYTALSERMIAAFVVPVFALYLLSLVVLRFPAPAGLNRRNVGILLIPIVIGLAVEAYSLLFAGRSRFLIDADAFVGNAIDSPERILVLILFGIGLPVVMLGIFSGGWLVRQRSRAGLLMLVAATLPILLLIAISPWVFVVERYALITLPAWLILTAVAVERLAAWLPSHGRWLAAAVLALLVADAAGAHIMYYQLNRGNRPDWREAFAYVESRGAAGDLIVTTRPELGTYYTGGEREVLDLATITPGDLAAENRTAWFVVDSEGVWSSTEPTRQWMEENAQLLLVWYLRMREQMDLKVYRYPPAGNSGK
jgi:mannosyltransferase